MNGSPGTCLAIDLGASSGRVMAGWLTSQGLLHLEEVHRFDNTPLMQDNLLTWNFDGLMTEIETGLAKGIAEAKAQGRPAKSIGIDSWGVDFGLLDENNELLGPVVHYRDNRTDGVMDAVKNQIGDAVIFAETGIQFLPFNTIYQLAALKSAAPATLEKARHFLMIADLVAWRLTGNITCEYTNATTTQLYNPNRGAWSEVLLSALSIPASIFSQVIQPGEVIGKLQGQWAADDITVIAVATHDTGSAVVGVPAQGDEFAYVSCGTWSLLGTEVPHPVNTAEALQANFTNEGGANNSIRLLKNIMGLWILQECRREWSGQGKDYSWPQLDTMAREAASSSIFDVDDARLLPPGNMPKKVRQIYREMGAPPPRHRWSNGSLYFGKSGCALCQCVSTD